MHMDNFSKVHEYKSTKGALSRSRDPYKIWHMHVCFGEAWWLSLTITVSSYGYIFYVFWKIQKTWFFYVILLCFTRFLELCSGVCCRMDTSFDKIPARAVTEDHWALQGKRCAGGVSDGWTSDGDRRRCCNAPVELRDAARPAHVRWRFDWQAGVPELADRAAGEGEGCWWHSAEAHHGSSLASECRSAVVNVQCKVKVSIALHGKPISEPFAIWDHTVLPATWHKWTRCPTITPASKLVLDLPASEGWKAELT